MTDRHLLLASFILRGLRQIGPSMLAPMFDAAGLNRNSQADQNFFCEVLAALNTCGYISGANEHLDDRGIAHVRLTEQGEAKADQIIDLFAQSGI